MVAWLREFGPKINNGKELAIALFAEVINMRGLVYVKVIELSDSKQRFSTCYRETNQGQLRRLKRPPKELR
jgi:hypothetical protein